eukprot:1158579-Pelagomonas_calceolata.AAC.2
MLLSRSTVPCASSRPAAPSAPVLVRADACCPCWCFIGCLRCACHAILLFRNAYPTRLHQPCLRECTHLCPSHSSDAGERQCASVLSPRRAKPR